MDPLRTAAPLARWLLSFAERQSSVVVHVRSGARTATLDIVQGRLAALDGVDGEPLGDTLLRCGALDVAQHGRALELEAPSGPVGRWLVSAGVVDAGSVQYALHEQLHARVARLLAWPAPELRVAPARPCSDELRADLVHAVWDGLLSLVRQLPNRELNTLVGTEALSLSRCGERLRLQLASAGLPLAACALSCSPETESSRCQRALFRVLGGVSEGRALSYSLLLRKQRQIRRNASAATLLDLSEPVVPEQARRAFRRLAFQLHPDRFQGGNSELQALSCEVMQALTCAEAKLRSVRRVG